MADIVEQRSVMEALRKAIDQRSFIIKGSPELTFPQLYNSIQWEADKNISLKDKLEHEKNRYKRPWLHLIKGTAESSALIRTLTGHSGWVEACAFSPDGRRIVSGSWDKTLKLWDTESGEEITTLKGHIQWVRACAFSPDSKRIVSGSDDKTLKLWDTESGKELATIKGYTGDVKACAFSPDGLRIVLGSLEGQVLMLSIENIEIFPAIVTPFIQSGELSFRCQYCQGKSQIDESSLGHEIKCSSCDNTVKLNPFTVNLD